MMYMQSFMSRQQIRIERDRRKNIRAVRHASKRQGGEPGSGTKKGKHAKAQREELRKNIKESKFVDTNLPTNPRLCSQNEAQQLAQNAAHHMRKQARRRILRRFHEETQKISRLPPS